jgi:hypothetical protein
LSRAVGKALAPHTNKLGKAKRMSFNSFTSERRKVPTIERCLPMPAYRESVVRSCMIDFIRSSASRVFRIRSLFGLDSRSCGGGCRGIEQRFSTVRKEAIACPLL